jgi:hypothetical protein
MQPIEGFLTVQLNYSRNCQGIVRTDFLNEFTISGGAGIRDNNKIKGSLFGPVALKPDFYWHFK